MAAGDPRLQALFDSFVEINSLDDLANLSPGDVVNVKNRNPHIVRQANNQSIDLYSVWFDEVVETSFDLETVSVMGNRIVPALFPKYTSFSKEHDGKEYAWRAEKLRNVGLLE
ncbi:MAG: hypothetical protein ACMXYD_03810 [Candidatus Woesearchaeota archaeon]